MDDTNDFDRTPPFAIRRLKGRNPAEQALLDEGHRIVEAGACMTDEEVEAWLRENDPERLLTSEQIKAKLAQARGESTKAAVKPFVVWDRDKPKPET